MSDPLDTLPIPRFLSSLLTKSVVIIGTCLTIFIGIFFKLWPQPAGWLLILLPAFAVIVATGVSNRYKPAGIVAGLTVLWVILEVKAPDVTAGARAVVTHEAAHTVQDGLYEVPRAVRCDGSTANSIVFFARHKITGEREARTWYSPSDGRCWDRPGVHPQSGEDLIAVTPEIVERIRQQSRSATTWTSTTDMADDVSETTWGRTYTFTVPARPP